MRRLWGSLLVLVLFMSMAGSARAQNVLQPLDCRLEGTLRSHVGMKLTAILFDNESSQTVQIFWLDYNGQRVFYNVLSPGTSYTQVTYVTHPWVVADVSGTCLSIYLPIGEPAKARLLDSNLGSSADR
jgi:hypothetical protein